LQSTGKVVECRQSPGVALGPFCAHYIFILNIITMSLRTLAVSAALIVGLSLVPTFAFADTNCATNNNWQVWNHTDTTCTAGTVLVYVQVNNNNGATRTPADFTVSVAGVNVTPSSFPGSLSGTAVKVNGAYSVSVATQPGYTASYSSGCTGKVVNNESATCIVTESNATQYSNYPYTYYPNQYTAHPFTYSYVAPLTCAPSGQTVTLGQSITFTAQGGEFSQFNWKNSFQPNNVSYNIGRSYTLTLNSPGTQTITVMNGSQSATCSVAVVGYPVPGYVYPGQTPGTTVYPGGVTLTPTYIPRLPNTGFGPIDSAALAFALAFLFAAGIATYPYARKAFATILR
jgi:hypothetical protein